jgi:hypothetical protein
MDPWTIIGWLILAVLLLAIVGVPLLVFVIYRSRIRMRSLRDFEKRRSERNGRG